MTTKLGKLPNEYGTDFLPDGHPSNNQPRPTGLNFTAFARKTLESGLKRSTEAPLTSLSLQFLTAKIIDLNWQTG